jgi:cytoskeletal protein CcmA (bactofilin family)
VILFEIKESEPQVSIFGKQKTTSLVNQPTGDVPPPPSTQKTVISLGTVIKGDIVSNDPLHTEGQIEGSLTVKNAVTVGKSGTIKANVIANSLQIHGKIIGDIVAAEKVSIERSGSVEGNIRSPKLMISEGAHFKGNIDMSHKTAESGPGGSTTFGGEKKKFELRGSPGAQSVATGDN